MPSKLERRIYEALRAGKGIRLSAGELDNLILADDAITTRIANAAMNEAGDAEWQGECRMLPSDPMPTWDAFVKEFAASS